MVVQYETSAAKNRVRLWFPQDQMNGDTSGDARLLWEDSGPADAYLIIHEVLKESVSGFLRPVSEYQQLLQKKLSGIITLDEKLEFSQEGITLITNRVYRGLRQGYPVYMTSASAIRVYACQIAENTLTLFDNGGSANTYFRGITVFFETRRTGFSRRSKIRFSCDISLPQNFISVSGQLFGGNYGFSDWVPLSPLVDRKTVAPVLSEEWGRLKEYVMFCRKTGGQ